MKERPILFSGPMVRAILEGRKTQTRRSMRPQPVEKDGWFVWDGHAPNSPYGAYSANHIDRRSINIFVGRCSPYGKVGDRLWVRETCRFDNDAPVFSVQYKADMAIRPGLGDPNFNRWRPSIHMPRWASRITLEITGVRVERLNEISDEDAIAEGISFHSDEYGYSAYGEYAGIGPARLSAVESFCSLWESINGAGSWSANPWVWVIEFKRI